LGVSMMVVAPAAHSDSATSGGMLGVVRPPGSTAQPSSSSGGFVCGACPAPPLTYHKGHVMLTSRVHALFWDPTFATNANGSYPPDYISGINAYFGDVAHDSGLATNVYGVARQYFQHLPNHQKQFIHYKVTNGAVITDANAYPTSG